MKIRSDFVSNSSSSSFVVAISQTYLLKDFVNDVAKNCSLTENHKSIDEVLLNRNSNILEFCLNSYELLFLGMIYTKTNELTYTLQKCIDIHGEDYGQELWNTDILVSATAQKNRGSKFKNDYYDSKTETAHLFYDAYAHDIVIDKYAYRFDVFDYRADKKTAEKEKVKLILEYAKNNDDHSNPSLIGIPECYEITKRTIERTESLINDGIDVMFDSDKLSLEHIKQLIKNGDRIFKITVNNNGDGYSTYALFENNPGSSLTDISCKILDNDYL